MRYFLDTEFIESKGYLKLISIALVDQNGKEYYAVSSDFDPEKCNDWVKENVLPKLPPKETWKSEQQISKEIVDFVGEAPEFWGYYCDYDWVVLCWLYGTMMDLPEGWPMFCLDLKQLITDRGFTKECLPKQDEDIAHNALEDAKWIKTTYEFVMVNQTFQCC